MKAPPSFGAILRLRPCDNHANQKLLLATFGKLGTFASVFRSGKRLVRTGILLAMLVFGANSRAVLTNDTAVTTTPTVANWTTGWGASGITGWDYVGQVGGASGVYLGNGWVLTASHVGAGNFTLDGVTYDLVTGSTTSIKNSNGTTADLVLFQIANPPSLPSLTISSTAPVKLGLNSAGASVVLIGFGGGAKSWGQNMVTANGQSISPKGSSTVTTDFVTQYGTSRYADGIRVVTVNNQAKAIAGDSGGAGFIYNAGTGAWELAGMMQAVDENGNTYLAQLNVYASQINAIRATTTVPEPDSTALMILAACSVAGGITWRNRHRFLPKIRRFVPIFVPTAKIFATRSSGS